MLAPLFDIDGPLRFGRGLRFARIRRPSFDPFRESRDFALGQLPLGGHLQIAAVLQHFHEETCIRIAGHNSHARIASRHPAGAAIQ